LPEEFKTAEALLTIEPLGVIVARNETLPVTFRHVTTYNGRTVYGFEFGELHARDHYVHADLMYADSDALPRFLISRRRHKNMLLGLAQFIYWGVSEPVRAISYALRKAHAGEAPADSIPQVSTVWLRRLLALMRVRAAADDRPSGQSGAA